MAARWFMRLRIIRACAGECAGRRVVAAEAGVIGVWNFAGEAGVNIRRLWAADGDHDIVENGDRISRQDL